MWRKKSFDRLIVMRMTAMLETSLSVTCTTRTAAGIRFTALNASAHHVAELGRCEFAARFALT